MNTLVRLLFIGLFIAYASFGIRETYRDLIAGDYLTAASFGLATLFGVIYLPVLYFECGGK